MKKRFQFERIFQPKRFKVVQIVLCQNFPLSWVAGIEVGAMIEDVESYNEKLATDLFYLFINFMYLFCGKKFS